MKPRYYATAVSWVGAAVAMRLAQDAEPGPESWCFTYLSDILVHVPTSPVSPPPAISLSPGPSYLSAESGTRSSLSMTPLIPTTPSLTTTSGSGASTTVGSLPTPSAPIIQEIIFFISPLGGARKRYLEARATQGFLNNDAPGPQQRCDNAKVYTLASGQLSDGGTPIHYSPGDNYIQLRSTGFLSDGAISTTFTVDGRILQFSNTSLPGGRADFCQDDAGYVYITFTSSPISCQPVGLISFAGKDCPPNIFRVNMLIVNIASLCQNGQIVGTNLPSATSTQATDASSVRTTNSFPADTTSSLPIASSKTPPDTSITSGNSLTTSTSSDNASTVSATGATSDSSSADISMTTSTRFIFSNSSTSTSPESTEVTKPEMSSSSTEVQSSVGPSTTSVFSIQSQSSSESTASSEQTSLGATSEAGSTTSPMSTSEIETSVSSPMSTSGGQETTQSSLSSETESTTPLSTAQETTSTSSSSLEVETSTGSSTTEETTSSSSSSSSSSTSSSSTATPTPVCKEGVEYAIYFFDEGSADCNEIYQTVVDYHDPLTLNLAHVIQGRIPQIVGVTQTTFAFTFNYQQLFYDSVVPPGSSSCFVIDHRGYLVASKNSQYTFELANDFDDLIYVWVGDTALSGFDVSNTVIRQSFGTHFNSQLSYTLTAGSDDISYIPIRLFYSNVAGPGVFQVSVTGSSGSTPEFSTCSRDPDAPFWPVWEQEQVGGDSQ